MAPNRRTESSTARLLRQHGLTRCKASDLALRRLRCGKGFRYVGADGLAIRDDATLHRLKSLAMPPAYEDVRYAAQPTAHLQATGRDAAGRLQYRYHPEWEAVREANKARRIAALAASLPVIRRAVRRRLRAASMDLDHAAAAAVLLVEATCMRAGGDEYARERGTRGATTLLKSNVRLEKRVVFLRFRAKGGKQIVRSVDEPLMVRTTVRLLELPGQWLFQYRKADGAVARVRASDVNDFLRRVSGHRISLKDYRTLTASSEVLADLAGSPPGPSQRARRKQINDAIASAARTLDNTPAICRKSYVHDSVIEAFESGALTRLGRRRTSRRPLARLVVGGSVA